LVKINKIMKHLKLYLNFSLVNSPSNEFSKKGAETFWELEDGTRVEITDVIEYLDSIKSPIIDINIDDVKELLIDVERDQNRVDASDLSFPIIISEYKGKYNSILDGQHRVVKSIKNKILKIKCRVLDLDNCPDIFKKIFIG